MLLIKRLASNSNAMLDCNELNDLLKSIMAITQLTFTCSKSTIETLEKGVKSVQISTEFKPFSSVSFVDFEQM